jgi:hypothetical protein
MKNDEKIKKEFLQVFRINAANISVSCSKVNISRPTYYKWMREDEDFANKIEDIRESMIDFAESKLFGLIKGSKLSNTVTDNEYKRVWNEEKQKYEFVIVSKRKKETVTDNPPDTAAVIFFLKTKGKQRGYIEKQIVENTNYNLELSEQNLDKFDTLTTEEKMKLVELNKKIYE